MKKSVVLLSGVGIGAGLLYLFNSSRRSSTPEPDRSSDGAESSARSGNGKTLLPKRDLGADKEAGRSSMGKVSGERTDGSEPAIDDRGTNQHEAAEILKAVRDAAFDSNDEKLALALGRPPEEIVAWTSGAGDVAAGIDGDVVMKARTLAINRGVEI